MFFSATTTEKTEALSKLALKKEPVYVGVDDNKELATVDGLEQGKSYNIICYTENFVVRKCLHSGKSHFTI